LDVGGLFGWLTLSKAASSILMPPQPIRVGTEEGPVEEFVKVAGDDVWLRARNWTV
jgi:hypothetical protein